MFSPLLKRFISMDPLGFSAGSMNLYETFGCDPVNNIDPMGTSVTGVGMALLDMWLTTSLQDLINNPPEPIPAPENPNATLPVALLMGGGPYQGVPYYPTPEMGNNSPVVQLWSKLNQEQALFEAIYGQGLMLLGQSAITGAIKGALLTGQIGIGVGRGIIEPITRVHDVYAALAQSSPHYWSLTGTNVVNRRRAGDSWASIGRGNWTDVGIETGITAFTFGVSYLARGVATAVGSEGSAFARAMASRGVQPFIARPANAVEIAFAKNMAKALGGSENTLAGYRIMITPFDTTHSAAGLINIRYSKLYDFRAWADEIGHAVFNTKGHGAAYSALRNTRYFQLLPAADKRIIESVVGLYHSGFDAIRNAETLKWIVAPLK
jgi:hypothetical protein